MLDSASSLTLGDAQTDLENLFSKHQAIPYIIQQFVGAGFMDHIREDTRLSKLPSSFCPNLLAQMVLHRRAKLKTLVGLLKRHFLASENPAQACADALYVSAEENLLDYSFDEDIFIMRWDITDEDKLVLARFQYPLPMIEPPLPVTDNRSYGYNTIRGSVILRDNHHEEDVCLDHINHVNSIPLSINADVVAFSENQWRNLSHAKEGETKVEYQARLKAFDDYTSTAKDVIKALLMLSDRFWLTHRYDKRGRTYAQGYHVNYQGNDWNKSVIEFADKEKLNDV